MINRPKDIETTLQEKGCYTALGYKAARTAAREGRSPMSASGEAHYQYDRPQLIAQSRDFMRNNGIYRGMIERAVNYIIGRGFTLQMRSGDPDFNATIERLWRDYWREPEIKGILSGAKTEKMICRESLVAGDTGAIKVNNGLLQLVEAEQIIGPSSKAKDGIKKNEFGRPISFFVSPYSRGGTTAAGRAKEIKAKDFIFVTDPDRPSATRSVPPCQSVFAMLHRINDVCDSEAIAWQVLSKMALSITRADADQLAYGESTADPALSGTDTEGILATRLMELDWAMIFHGQPGEKIEGIDRNIPGRNLSDCLTMFLRLMGLPLGLPLEIILLDWTKSNYSQSRAVLEQAFQSFTSWQDLYERRFYDKVLAWKINTWIEANGVGPPPEDYLKHEWIKPSFPWIDQLKEAQAQAAKLDRTITTHGEVCKSLGRERADLIKVREAEIRGSIGIVQKIKVDTGVDVPWEIFAGLDPKKAPSEAVKTGDQETETGKDNNAKPDNE